MKKGPDPAFLEEEIRCGYSVTEQMKHVWAVELDLIEKLKEVCERNHLKYYMAGGTLLGAVRHQGFIPWDDDVDLSMPREDFEKLKQIAPQEFMPPYFLQTEDSDPDIFLSGPARLINCDTTCIQSLHMEHTARFGIWIDITVMDAIYEDVNKRERQIKRIRHYQLLLFAQTYHELNCLPGLSTFEWTAYRILAYFISRAHLCRQLKKAQTRCSASNHVTSFSYRFDRSQPFLFEKADYRDFILLDFESIKLPGPVGFNRCLRTQYGDYMKYPPEGKRTTGHSVILDPFIPYDSFLLNFDRIVSSLQGRTVVVFGAGQMLEHYLHNKGKKYPPEFIVDNNNGKWGTEVHGIPVKRPDALLNIPGDKLQIIICSIYYREIAKQLREMGINRYYIYVQERAWL